jgi:hypothetical protein
MCVSGLCFAADFVVVEDGGARATVVLAPEASPDLEGAAKLLVDCVHEATGATLPVARSMPKTGNAICIGAIPGVPMPDLAGLDDDGYVISFPQEGVLSIHGPTDWGTEFGVDEFLERWVGVRWLLPGDDGTDVPPAESIIIRPDTVRQEPAFFSRLFSGLRGAAQATWARRNRMHGRVSFHHNLIHVFPPETYTKTHPEFFPLKAGQTERFLPETNSTHGWQPCFTAPGLVDEAVRQIDEVFAEHPDRTSFSLGTNDSSGYCACPECLKRITGEKNFLGRVDYSDLYFDWANQVIDGVLKTYPDRVFGCLAYSEVAAPPKHVSVHPRLIPYMTYDRMKWIDAELRKVGEDATRAWHAKSPTLGWYDYIYGSPYCLPRVWFHHMADYYRFGHANGVRALYAEAYPNWGEGPKLYISLKLQWNPQADVDALLKEWYERCVGPEAAPYLAQYYTKWEDFWTRRILDSAWFTQNGQYLRFSSADYLADVDLATDIDASRHLLEKTVALAKTPKQKARARLLLLAFEYYEASAYAYQAGAEAGDVRNEADALRLIDHVETCAGYAVRRRDLATKVFPENPVLCQPLGIDRYPAISGASWGAGTLWRIYDVLARSAPDSDLRTKVAALAKGESALRDQARVMLRVLDGGGEPLTKNASFEEGTDAAATGWTWWVKWNTGRMYRTDQLAHTGTYSVCFDGMKRGGPVQQVPVEPGRYGLVCFVYVPAEQSTKGSVELAMTMRDDKDVNLPSAATTIVPTPGRWTAVAVVQEVPAEVNGKPVKTVMPILIPTGYGPGDKVYFDDLQLFRLGE